VWIKQYSCEVEIGKWIGVLSCGGVEAAIITTGKPSTIFFRDHVERRGPGTV
jgi:hypothetical protein